MDDAKFEEAWSACGPAVLRYCTYSTGSPQDGEDVLVETFARYLAKGDHVAPANVEAWLIRVARNLCANHHLGAKRRRALESRLAEGLSAETSGWTRPESWEYVRRLKETERLVVYLRIAEDRSFSDVARLVGRSEGAVKMTFYRAIDRLRRDMKRDGAGPDLTLEGGTEYA